MRYVTASVCALGLATLLVAADPKPAIYTDKTNLLNYFNDEGKLVSVKTPADVAKRREHTLANMQRVMGPLPPESAKVPLDLKVEGEETLPKVLRKKVTFAVEKGDRLTAYLLIPRNLVGKAPAVLCLHQTTGIGKAEPAGVGGKPNLHYALELAERGYITLAPDYPGYGDYKLDSYAKGYASATMKGVWNHMRAVDLLQSLPEVDAERIGCIGHSLGGHNAMFVTAFDPRIKIVVSSCGFNSFTKYRKGHLSDWSHKGYMPRIKTVYGDSAAKMPFDFPDVIAAIAPRAIFVNAPLKDNDFEVEGVYDCMASAKPLYKALGVPNRIDAVHPDCGHDFPPAERQLAYAAVDRELKSHTEFTRMIAHWAEYADPDYLDFVKDARPEICQLGFYGGHFYSLAHTPEYKGYPAHFPVRGLKECGQWFEDRNAAVHKLGSKVVGHFNVEFLVGEPESKDGPRGFFKFYRELWDEKELGPKPVKDPLDLIARNADGTPMASKQYSIGQMREFTACLNNPHWRTVLKAWVKRAVERGVDGLIANYFYRHNCLCEYCQAKFRGYMGERFTPVQMKDQFAIGDIKTHKFDELIGWHNPKESTPLRREMLRWSQISCKEAFDEVFVKHGKSLKPGLIVGQWNHLGNFGQINVDERCLLPTELWGRDEDYLWYSTGGAAFYTDLANGFLGEGTLQARYIRGAFDDKPFTLGKYESTRTRATIAELAANGGAPLGFYARHKDPLARAEMTRYFGFMAKYDNLFKANKPHAEVLLLYPRSRVHVGDVAAVEAFKDLGMKLLNEHVLFDVLPDEMLTDSKRAAYRVVLNASTPTELPKGLSTFAAPQPVRVSASRPASGNEITLHFVNYNREEPKQPKSAGGGLKDEKPIAADGVTADFALPAGVKVAGVSVLTPEAAEPVEVKFTVEGGRLKFAVPKFLVYSVVRVRLAE